MGKQFLLPFPPAIHWPKDPSVQWALVGRNRIFGTTKPIKYGSGGYSVEWSDEIGSLVVLKVENSAQLRDYWIANGSRDIIITRPSHE